MEKKVLLPTDSSLPALVATIEAVKMAKERNAKLIILNVVEMTPVTGVEEQAENVALKRCSDIDGMAFAKALAMRDGVPYEEVIREGPVSGEIVNVANTMGAEVIVMGSSAPSGLRGLYLGDVARAVAKHAKCEVVTINPTKEQGMSALELARSLDGRRKPVTVKHLTSTKQFKVGLALFGIYVAFYAALMIMGSFERDLMSERFLGLNVGLVMGILAIFIAIIMAILFNWYAVKMEKAQEG
ncbi:MAG: universal stress protein [Methanomassiliicoccales archaeon]|nr:MAG: universal stress protein [Methanomassiliicoccales archaeon]